MKHLTPGEFIDAVEDTLAPARRAHLASCGVCSQQAAQLATVLRETREIEIPEPSPLFWDRLSERVQTAIVDAGVPEGRLPRWLRWPVLVPLGGLALIILALFTAVPRESPRSDSAAISNADGQSVSPNPAEAADAGWAVISGLVQPLDVDVARAAGIGMFPGAAERAVLQMTGAEQKELLRLLREEIERSGG